MSFSLWTKEATPPGVLVDTDGQTPLYCETCPCEDVDVDLNLAIYERQLAFGIIVLWDVGDPNNINKLIHLTNVYTLPQYKAYVNNISGLYLDDNAYVGGASAPGTLSATYANSAADTDALTLLVVAMKYTLETPALDPSDEWRGFDINTASYSDCKANAEADFQDIGSSTLGTTAVSVSSRRYSVFNCSLRARSGEYSLAGLTTGLQRRIRLFVQAKKTFFFVPFTTPTYVFNTQGFTNIPAEDQYGDVVDEVAFTTSAAFASGEIITAPDLAPPTWPPAPADNLSTQYGFRTTDPTCLIEWEFTA